VILLGLHTSTRLQSVALVIGEGVVGEECFEAAAHHSVTVLPAIERILGKAGLEPGGISAIAVTSGPGTFTGLRVGLATAKGLAMASGAALGGFSTLKILAEALVVQEQAAEGSVICPLIDAARGQLYRCLYRVDGKARPPWQATEFGSEAICDPREALRGLPPGSVAGGEGLRRHGDLLRADLPAGVRLAGDFPSLAPIMARRAAALLAAGEFPRGALEPNYIRPPDTARPRA
jgi:tRNA threonylcarbamoyladenosine biosynthesis protein TsaB